MIRWLDIPVSNLERAGQFYGQVLNIAVFKQQDTPPSAIFTLGQQKLNICLIAHENLKPSSDGPLIYLTPNQGIDESMSKISLNGGKILEQPQAFGDWGKRLIFIDSEGNRLALFK